MFKKFLKFIERRNAAKRVATRKKGLAKLSTGNNIFIKRKRNETHAALISYMLPQKQSASAKAVIPYISYIGY